MVFPGMAGDLQPMVTAAVSLRAAGATVEVVAAGCEATVQRTLSSAGVGWRSLGVTRYPRRLLGKVFIRSRFLALLRSAVQAGAPDVIWYHTAAAMEYLPWMRRLAPRATAVAHAHELYDGNRRLRVAQERAIGKAVCWVVPSPDREAVLRNATGSRAPCWVVPNRALETLATPASRDGTSAALFRAQGGSPTCSRFIIYQGLVAEPRCLLEAVEAFRMLDRPEVGLIVLGECRDRGFGRRLRQAVAGDPRVVFADRIPFPEHLRVTIGCEVGLMLYAPTGLNNRLCAPNKLYEYAWCGLGVVMSNFPHLAAMRKAYGFGSPCDPTDPSEIMAAIVAELDRDVGDRRRAAEAFLRASPSPLQVYRDIDVFLAGAVGGGEQLTRC